jgi:urea ABC transporter urea binding protein
VTVESTWNVRRMLSMGAAPALALLFGPFRLDLPNETLWRGSERIPLRPKTFAVLLYLVQHPQRLITKEELLKNVWRGVVVDDELLRGYVRELRLVLGDSATEPQFVETIARRGYRFVAAVTVETLFDSSASESSPPQPSTLSGAPHVARARITVGILHSLKGMMAWTEVPVVDATLLAIEEINQRGGICGKQIEPVVSDGQSEETTFAAEAERLIDKHNVSALFGCWTSASRKAVLPVVEERDHLLFYPVQYEGMEASRNVIYTGAAPNQQIIPAVRWAFGFLRARRLFLVGWNSIYSWAAHEIIRDEVASLGGQVVGEAHLKPDGTNIPETVRQIVASSPDLILNSTVGDLNLLYSRVLRAAGVTSERVPTIYFSVGETELMSLTGQHASGDYAAWNYFQSIDRPENHAFIKRFRTRYGPQRVTTDPMEASYIAVNLWAQAAEAVDANDTGAMRQAVCQQRFEAPEGVVRVDSDTQHIWKTVRVGQIGVDNQFEIVWSSERPVRPEPFPTSRPREAWKAFLVERYRSWGGRWTPAPSPASL